MTEEGLKVRFIGDSGSLEQASNRANNALDKVGRQATKTGVAIQKNTKDFTALNRVLADSPFGILGVSNNLQQLLPAAGAAGLAITAITTALTFAQVGLTYWTKGVKDNKKTLEEAKEAVEKYINSLDDINRFRLTGNQDAQKQIVDLRTLYEATQNANIPLAERKKIVDQLQDQYPAYFKNIKDEIILAGGAQKAYEKLTASILSKARAEAGKKQIEELAKQQLVIDQQVQDALQRQAQASEKYGETLEKNTKEIAIAAKIGESDLAFRRGINVAAQAYLRARKETVGLEKQSNDLLERQKRIAASIQDLIIENGADTLDLKIGDINVDKAKRIIQEKLAEPIRNIKTSGIFDAENNPLFSDELSGIKFDRIKVKPLDVPIRPRIAPLDDKQINEVFKGIEKAFRLEVLKENLSKIVTNFQTELATSLGEGIGQAIASGNFSDITTNIGQVIGNYMQAVGKELITASVLFQKVKIALATLFTNPLAGIGVGIGLIAAGAAIKAKLGKIKAFRDGGIAYGPTLGVFGEYANAGSNPEVVAPLNKLKSLIGGGTNMPDFIPVLRGDTLMLMLNRTQRKQGRTR